MSDPAINPVPAPPRETMPAAQGLSLRMVVPASSLPATAAAPTLSAVETFQTTPEAVKGPVSPTSVFTVGDPKAPTPASADPVPSKGKGDDKWKIRFSMGMNATNYHTSDVHFSGPVVNGDINGVKWHERKSDSYWNPMTWQTPQNALQWIDEPSNAFNITAQKGKNEYMINMFHPKYLMDTDQVDDVHATVDGVRHDGPTQLRGNDGSQPGALHIGEMKNTHRQFEFEAGYGREFPVYTTKSGDFSLIYRPAVYAGVMAGHSVSQITHSDGTSQSWDEPYKVQGVVASIGNKVELRIKDRVSLMAEYKVSAAHITQGEFGGTATYNMVYTPLTFGVGVKLFDQNNHGKHK